MAKKKWDGLKGKYPVRAAGGDESYLELVRRIRESHVGLNLGELAEKYAAADKEKEEYETKIAGLNAELEALSQTLLEELDNQGLTSADTQDGRKLSARVRPFPSVSDVQMLEAHISANPGLDYLYSVQPKRLEALVNELLIQGKDSEIPPGVTVYLKSSVGFTKS